MEIIAIGDVEAKRVMFMRILSLSYKQVSQSEYLNTHLSSSLEDGFEHVNGRVMERIFLL